MAKHRSSKISENGKTQLTLSHCDSKGYILHRDFWLLFRDFFYGFKKEEQMKPKRKGNQRIKDQRLIPN